MKAVVTASCFQSLVSEGKKLNPYPLSLPELQKSPEGDNNSLIKALMWQTHGPLSLYNDVEEILQGLFKKYTKIYGFRKLKDSIILCGDEW